MKANFSYATVYNNASGKPVWMSDGPQSNSWLARSSTLWIGC
jgi:hypothetical protein